MAQTPEERVFCLLVGAVIGEESVLLSNNIGVIASVRKYAVVGEAMREGFRKGISEHRETLAKLVPEAVGCGLGPETVMVRAWDEADRRLRDLVDRPTDEAVHDADAAVIKFVEAIRSHADASGVDPPLLRNLRRINANVPGPARAEKE